MNKKRGWQIIYWVHILFFVQHEFVWGQKITEIENINLDEIDSSFIANHLNSNSLIFLIYETKKKMQNQCATRSKR